MTAVIASIGPGLAVGDPLIACGGDGMHCSRREQVDFLHFKRSHPGKSYIHLFSRVSPDDSTSWRGTNAIYGVHMAPFLTALAMVRNVRRRPEASGGVRLGVNVVSTVRTLIIYLKCTIILHDFALRHSILRTHAHIRPLARSCPR